MLYSVSDKEALCIDSTMMEIKFSRLLKDKLVKTPQNTKQNGEYAS